MQTDTYFHIYELVLNPGVSFESQVLRSGKRIVCSRSAVGFTQKWITPVDEVLTMVKNSNDEIAFKTIVATGKIKNTGTIGGAFCKEGISWNQ